MVKRTQSGAKAGVKRAKHDASFEMQLREDQQKASGALMPKHKAPKRTSKGDDDDEGEGVDEKMEKKVLALAKAQQSEERQREELEEEAEAELERTVRFADDDDDDDDEIGEGDDVSEGDGDGAFGAEALTDAETRLVESFMAPQRAERRTLADVIMQKIAEQEARQGGDMADEDEEDDALPAKVVEAYGGMAKLLAGYRSGKLPKAFKVIPSLERWEDVLWLTRPDEWSPHCVEAATKVFASNLDPKRAKVFFEQVLLQRCRDDVRSNKKLNYHLYQALHRAVFKPAAWFKGVLLPLCAAGDVTLREALIFSSVLAKASVPAAHAAVVLLKLAGASAAAYSGAASIFIIVLLNKKYSLPLRVLGALVQHFCNFGADDRTLPVLWHQSLLIFVQRYHADLDDKQRENLKVLCKKHVHASITPEVRRELNPQTKRG